jgi:hypothetical protein
MRSQYRMKERSESHLPGFAVLNSQHLTVLTMIKTELIEGKEKLFQRRELERNCLVRNVSYLFSPTGWKGEFHKYNGHEKWLEIQSLT